MIEVIRGNGQGVDKGDIIFALVRNDRRGRGVGKIYGLLDYRRVMNQAGEKVWRLTLHVTTDPVGRHPDVNEQHYHVYDADIQRGLELVESFFRLNYSLTGNRSPIELCQIKIQMLGSCNYVISRVTKDRAMTAVQFIRKHDIE